MGGRAMQRKQLASCFRAWARRNSILPPSLPPALRSFAFRKESSDEGRYILRVYLQPEGILNSHSWQLISIGRVTQIPRACTE